MKKPLFLTKALRPVLAAVAMVAILASTTPLSFAATPAGTPVGVPGKGSSGASGAVSPVTQPGKITESRALQEQRRVELRAALRDQKRRNDEAARAASAVTSDDATLTERHLNAQQRAEMRQQLADQSRQQRFEYVNTKP